MSFSTEVKNELARTEPQKKSSQLAEIAGFVRVAGSIRLEGGGRFRIVLTTDNPAIARHYMRLFKEYFRIEPELEIGEASGLVKGHSYMLTIGPKAGSEQILRETGILLVREGNNYISDGIYEDVTKTKSDRKAYLRGIFLGAGSVTDPQKSYHLEMICATDILARDLTKLINTFVDLTAKIVERRGRYVVYMKNSAYIRDTLAIMGANSHVLVFDDVMIKKQMMNDTVRITNCDSANTDRTLDASQRQIAAILSLKEKGELDRLPYSLREIAELRLENPEASLQDLGDILDPPLKKSGVSNRIRKLMEAAETNK